MPVKPFHLPLLPAARSPALPESPDGLEHAALATLAGLDGMLNVTRQARLFREMWLLKEALCSSAIEGYAAELEDVLAVQAGLSVPDESEATRHVLNCRRTLRLGLEAMTQGEKISLSLIKRLHREILADCPYEVITPGEWRKIPVHIGLRGLPREKAVYNAPLPGELHGLLDNWIGFLDRADISPVIAAAILHAQFEMIHPFADGNGRLGRALITLVLSQKGLGHGSWFGLSPSLLDNREEYFRRLALISQTGNWEPWLAFFLTCIIRQCEHLTAQRERMLTLYTECTGTLAAALNSAMAPATLDFLFTSPVFTISAFIRTAGVNRPLAAQLTDKLLDAGVIEQIHPGRGRRPALYRFPELLDLLSSAHA